MKSGDVTRFLQGLGLSEYEARSYSVLSISGTMRAGDISKESGVPQSKVYWVLDDLIEKQMVEVCEGKPKEYRAVQPDVALKRLVEEKEIGVESAPFLLQGGSRDRLRKDLKPAGDLYNSAATKLHLAGVLLDRAWNTLGK